MPGTSVTHSPRQVESFTIDGRIALSQGDKRFHANFSWRHQPQRDNLLLTGPLGQGLAELDRNESGARLVTADRGEFMAADWESLAEKALGTRLPLNDLPGWLAGHAPPAATGWRVEYLDYESSAADALPTLMEFSREDIQVRVKIDQWNLQP